MFLKKIKKMEVKNAELESDIRKKECEIQDL